ncbi:MAG: FTR1 family protein [Algicola sp.]|nr:FTR1 family protein [Algicola sp.]
MLLAAFLFGATVQADSEPAQLRQLMQLAEYIGADYAEAVTAGEVTDSGEYQEMLEFGQLIVTNALPNSPAFANQANALLSAIKNKATLAAVQNMTNALRGELLALAPQSSIPTLLLPKAEVAALFQSSCGGCHGMWGQGDGTLAASLEPAPTDFTDRHRALNRSVLGLYDAINNGIDGTAMPAFDTMTEQQRWSLSFYVGSLGFDSLAHTDNHNTDLQQRVNYSPNQLFELLSLQQPGKLDQLRAYVENLSEAQPNPLVFTSQQLRKALTLYQSGHYNKAQTLSVSAYLDGFELVENALDIKDSELRKSIETQLMALRRLINNKADSKVVENAVNEAVAQLAQAQKLLSGSSLSSEALFTASFVILLREGLEALLVIIALITVLRRTGRLDALKYVHFGWVSALLAGFATWYAAQYLITISGASREVMEGVAALLAAIVLFYVGFWMHSKTHANQWQRYIEQNIHANLKLGTLWGIWGLAFIAVYREVFETVLFYQSLLSQAKSTDISAVASGFIAALAGLGFITWFMTRYSVKLPIKRFFALTTYILLALSFVLLGKAIGALQEADLLSLTPFPYDIEMSWIGVYSTWQNVVAQSVVLLLSARLLLGFKQGRLRKNQA